MTELVSEGLLKDFRSVFERSPLQSEMARFCVKFILQSIFVLYGVLGIHEDGVEVSVEKLQNETEFKIEYEFN